MPWANKQYNNTFHKSDQPTRSLAVKTIQYPPHENPTNNIISGFPGHHII